MLLFDSKAEYFKRLLLLLDLAVLAIAFVIAVALYPYIRPGETSVPTDHYGLLPVLLTVFAISRSVISKDLFVNGTTRRAQILCLTKELAITITVVLSLIFILKLEYVSRVILITFGFGAAIGLIAVRLFIIWWYFLRQTENLSNRLNVLVIGSGHRAHMLVDQIKNASEWGVNVVGFLDPKGKSAGRRAEDEILGHVDQISEILRDNVIEEVIVAVPRSLLGDVQKIVDACQEEGVRLWFMANVYDFAAARIRLTMINDIPLLSFEPVARAESHLLVKRIFDLVVILAAMPIILPIFCVVAFAIKVDSRGPAMFTQERVGLHKRRFKLRKFRSMVIDAEEKMHEVEHLNEAAGPNFKIENDPRVTRLGKVLRKYSIDELPQLLNVLMGHMSLVGPRPMSVRDVNLFDKGAQRKRFSVRPGITCLWQVSGRSNLSFDEWLALDLEYIEKWSFWLDMKILFRTIPTVLKASGAV